MLTSNFELRKPQTGHIALRVGTAGTSRPATALFHLDPRDPVTFGGAAAVLVAVAVLAAWLPAHRAARLDPVTVLREG
jgi:putative ABC transport system permease protein